MTGVARVPMAGLTTCINPDSAYQNIIIITIIIILSWWPYIATPKLNAFGVAIVGVMLGAWAVLFSGTNNQIHVLGGVATCLTIIYILCFLSDTPQFLPWLPSNLRIFDIIHYHDSC